MVWWSTNASGEEWANLASKPQISALSHQAIDAKPCKKSEIPPSAQADRISDTPRRVVVDEVCCEPFSARNSLFIRENTGNFVKSGPREGRSPHEMR